MGNRTLLLLVVATYFATEPTYLVTRNSKVDARNLVVMAKSQSSLQIAGFKKFTRGPNHKKNYMQISLNCHCRLQICAQLLNLRFILQKLYGINWEIHSLDW